jgi:hypothetical protein
VGSTVCSAELFNGYDDAKQRLEDDFELRQEASGGEPQGRHWDQREDHGADMFCSAVIFYS